eukprot:6950722-Pyramimonas_sp.AAC.1
MSEGLAWKQRFLMERLHRTNRPPRGLEEDLKKAPNRDADEEGDTPEAISFTQAARRTAASSPYDVGGRT